MTDADISKPECLIPEHLTFLNDLRESGVTDMYGAAPYLREVFEDLSKEQARAVVVYWMKTFSPNT